ncbi:hypothetical protein LXL04_027735 [Taraxacum kok-saghyz]
MMCTGMSKKIKNVLALFWLKSWCIRVRRMRARTQVQETQANLVLICTPPPCAQERASLVQVLQILQLLRTGGEEINPEVLKDFNCSAPEEMLKTNSDFHGHSKRFPISINLINLNQRQGLFTQILFNHSTIFTNTNKFALISISGVLGDGFKSSISICVAPLQALKLSTTVLGDGFNSSTSGVLVDICRGKAPHSSNFISVTGMETNHLNRDFSSSPSVFEKSSRPMLGRKELYKNSLRKVAYAWKLINDLNLSEEEVTFLRQYTDEPSYTDLQWNMFVPAIEGQGTEEQKDKWLPLAKKMQVIGCYAQTQLGHGPWWWPGGMGKVATHGIVYARLIVNCQFHGVHGFIVQLRSLEDHSPLPALTIGDIGLKFGNGAYNTMDNGVLRFDHVRIPRNQMLMRVSQVTKEGNYTQSDVPQQLQHLVLASLSSFHIKVQQLGSISFLAPFVVSHKLIGSVMWHGLKGVKHWIYCSMLGSKDEDVILLEEPAQNIHVNIRHTKDYKFVTVNVFSTTYSKVFLINAVDLLSGLTLIWECEPCAHCIIEHHQGYLYFFTNADRNGQSVNYYYILRSCLHSSNSKKVGECSIPSTKGYSTSCFRITKMM